MVIAIPSLVQSVKGWHVPTDEYGAGVIVLLRTGRSAALIDRVACLIRLSGLGRQIDL
jgi:hypothetical protein